MTGPRLRKPIRFEIATEPEDPETAAKLDRMLDTMAEAGRVADTYGIWMDKP